MNDCFWRSINKSPNNPETGLHASVTDSGYSFFRGLLNFVKQGFTRGRCETSGTLPARAGAIAPSDREEGQSLRVPVPQPSIITASGPGGRFTPRRP